MEVYGRTFDFDSFRKESAKSYKTDELSYREAVLFSFFSRMS